jgi:hypothetical protein
MHSFFHKQRFGEPQFLAGLLLLFFLTQCAWLVRSGPGSGRLDAAQQVVIRRGLEQWQGKQDQSSAPRALGGDEDGVEFPSSMTDTAASDIHRPPAIADPNHSALYYLVLAAPLRFWPTFRAADSLATWGWLASAPGLLFGLCLGASVWYVARRLYGNAGGYIALTLFCFAPGFIRASAGWFSQPETGAAWGAFGAIFTGIAVAHTLYAPREVVLWNWRRIVLLGVALAMGIGSQFSLVVLIPLVLAFVLYLAPRRRRAALVIWGTACAIASLLLLASYFFRIPAFCGAMRSARFLPITGRAFVMLGAYRQLLREMVENCPALLVGLPVALAVFVLWRRTRYFGNAAPLLLGVLFLALGLTMPHYPGLGFRLIALPFLFLFVAGIAADALETRYRAVILAAIAGLLSSYALWSMLEVARARA